MRTGLVLVLIQRTLSFTYFQAPIATDENQQPASDESADGRQERDIGAQGSSDPTKALPTDDHTTVIPYSWPKVEIAASETESRLQELDSIVTILDSLPTERIFEDWFAVDCDPAKRVGFFLFCPFHLPVL